MGRGCNILLVVIAAIALVTLNLTTITENFLRRTLKAQAHISQFTRRQRRVISQLAHPNETITEKLSAAAHSYCDGNDLEEYPMPKYDACPPDSVLNVIPFFGGMTNALKFVVLGALMSFEENRCFIISEKNAHLNPGHKFGKTDFEDNMGNFVDHFFERIGLPYDHPFAKERMEEGKYKVRKWEEYWTDLRMRRTALHRFSYNTTAYSHSTSRVDGVTLKRDFMRHMWHLLPFYRENTCEALKDQKIFDTDYIALSIRRGDKTKEHFTFPDMDVYIKEAEDLIPHVFKEGQKPRLFVATDDCTVLDTLRQERPEWEFLSPCEKLARKQKGYDITDIPKFNNQQREEHFRKFFIELYALAFAKVFIGVAYTNVSWWAYMMRPDVSQDTFILVHNRQGQATLNYW